MHEREHRLETYARDRHNFDFLRFALVTAVIWSLCFPILGRDANFTAAISVNAFFIMSGFLVTQSWLTCPDPLIFACKRLLQICPALVLALAFGALVIAPLVSDEPARTYFLSGRPWRHFMSVPFNRYLYCPGLFADNPVHGLLNLPLWSLRYEMVCYALVPLLCVGAARHWKLGIIAVFVISCLAQPMLWTPGATDPLHIQLFTCFATGMLYYAFRDRIPYRLALAAIAGATLVGTYDTRASLIALPMAGGYLLFYLAFARWLPVHGFGRYGDFSYSLYVFAFPIQQAIVHFLGTDLTLPLFFLAAFGSTLVLAIASWHLVEAPALALKPHASHNIAAALPQRPPG